MCTFLLLQLFDTKEELQPENSTENLTTTSDTITGYGDMAANNREELSGKVVRWSLHFFCAVTGLHKWKIMYEIFYLYMRQYKICYYHIYLLSLTSH